MGSFQAACLVASIWGCLGLVSQTSCGQEAAWYQCCDFMQFDMVANPTCFPSTWHRSSRIPSWAARACCSVLGSARLAAFWRGLLAPAPSVARPAASGKSRAAAGAAPTARAHSNSSSRRIRPVLFLPHRKCGNFLADTLVTRLFEPHLKLPLHFAVRHQSMAQLMLPDVLPSSRMGLVVHLVRKPSDIVVSSYRYHLRAAYKEEWLDFKDPPSCVDCDHWAWVDIFKRCRFHCSYRQVLANESVAEGLGVEVLRSRWGIMKMLAVARSWQDHPRVLQLDLGQFVASFEGTLRCLLRFLAQTPVGGAGVPMPTDMQGESLERLVLLSRVLPLDIGRARRKCDGAEVCDDEAWRSSALWRHASTDSSDRRALRAELRQRVHDWDFFLAPANSLLAATLWASSTASLYGCGAL
eukprot:CAMPEP_0117571408 /NCGR_PEP_ID=MMETSP0784-20121206/59735_1 /TAXON_ID=39447 /ORGANISM="" /LENGTH=410 /DNA_ID=CAMNT_0005369565 /DNA_START=31 /DNA_END=1260 /DNA_ORIENTATION=-